MSLHYPKKDEATCAGTQELVQSAAKAIFSTKDSTIAALTRERDAWKETAAQHCQNEEFWRELVMKIGDILGPETRVQDDGEIVDRPLGLKVPEVAAKMIKERDDFKGKLDEALASVAVLYDCIKHQWCQELDGEYICLGCTGVTDNPNVEFPHSPDCLLSNLPARAQAEIERVRKMREALERLINSADQVGIKHFDTNILDDDVLEMQEATEAAKDALS